MKKLFHTTVLIGLSQVLMVLLQIMRAKFIALLIGPTGAGVIGNTSVFMGVLENLCYFGFHIALLRYASEKISEKNYNDAGKLLSTTFLIHIALSFLGIAISLIFLQQINTSIYQNQNLLFVSIFAILSAPFAILYGDFGNLFNALNNVKVLAKLNVFPAIVSLCSIVPLVFVFGVKGAVISFFFESLILFLISLFVYKRYYADKIKIGRSLFSKTLALKMLKYGGVFQINIIINTIAAYLIRILVTAKLSLAGAGIFNSALSMGSYLFMLQTPLSIYLYPKISSIHKDKRETAGEINRILRFSLIILIPAAVCIILFSDIAIKLLLSKAFLAIVPIIVWILIARLFDILQLLIGLPLFIMERLRTCFSITVIFNVILVGLSYALLEKFGLMGVAAAQGVSYILLFALYLVAARKTFGFQLDRINVYYIISGLCLFAVSGYFKEFNLIWRLVPLSVTLIWLVFGVKRREWVFLFNYAGQYLPFIAKK